MSWTTSTAGRKEEVDHFIDALGVPHALDGRACDQLSAAKRAAKEVLKSVPGPRVAVTLSGHANGVGWHKKDGYSNDFITISVTQQTA
jgi:hypothetical protein